MTFSPLVVSAGQTQRLPSNGVLNTNAPAVRVSRTSDYPAQNSGPHSIVFNQQVFSYGGAWWSSTVNPDRLTCPVAGVYLIGATARLNLGSQAYLNTHIELNGSTFIHTQVWQNVNTFQIFNWSNQVLWELAQGDYIRLIFSNWGVPFLAQSGVTPALWAVKVR